MAHVTSGKAKTNMFLIWCGPDGEDVCDNFELEEHEMYNINHIIDQFEPYCEPICNFRAARYKFQQVIITFKNSVCNASSVTTRNI